MEFNRISLLEVNSTNNYASNLLKSETLPHGTVITAQYQTKGKGQRENQWLSKANDNLLASWIFHFQHFKITDGFLYNKSVALAVRAAIAQFLSSPVTIKWPNDVIVNNKKIAGILIENTIQGDCIKTSVCGIGVNIFQREFSIPTATSLILENSNISDLDDFLKILHQQLSLHLEVMLIDSNKIHRDYLANLFRIGEPIEFVFNNKQCQGLFQGVDEWGRIIIFNDEIHLFQSGEIQWLWT